MIRASKIVSGPAGPVCRVLALAALLAVLGFSGPARAGLPIRVLLVRGGLSVRVFADATLRIYALAEERLLYAAEGGGPLLVRARGDRVLIGEAGGRSLPAGGVRFRAFGGPIRMNGTPYRGAIDVAASGGRLWVVNTVRLEDYLRGVVGREIPSGWPRPALRAQAVAARTFTLLIRAQADKKAKGRALFHLTAGTGDQVYGGMPAENPAIDSAVAATEGLVVTYRGKIARAFFHASSGGRTEAVGAVWPSIGLPYLRGVPVPLERGDPAQEWRATVGLGALRRALVRTGRFVGRIRAVTVVGRTASGRASRVRIDHRGGRLTVRAALLRRVLGYTRVRSTLFRIDRNRDVLIFRGRGFGHGVGMSQQGARLLAESGKSYTEILAFFYPGTSLLRAEEAAFPDAELLVPQEIDDLSLLLR